MENIKWEHISNSHIHNKTLEIYDLPLTYNLNIIDDKLFICRNNYYHILIKPKIEKEKYTSKIPISLNVKSYMKLKYKITFKNKISSNRKNKNNPIDNYLNEIYNKR